MFGNVVGWRDKYRACSEQNNGIVAKEVIIQKKPNLANFKLDVYICCSWKMNEHNYTDWKMFPSEKYHNVYFFWLCSKQTNEFLVNCHQWTPINYDTILILSTCNNNHISYTDETKCYYIDRCWQQLGKITFAAIIILNFGN